MQGSFAIGQRIEITGTVRDLSNSAVDPDTVTFRMKEPDGAVTVWVYGTDPELEKTGTGAYRVEWTIAQPGQHWFRFEGTGTAEAAEEDSVLALASKVL